MKTTTIVALSAALLMSACATHPNNIRAQYVSPMMYANYSCDQLREENARVTSRVMELTASQRRRANNDTAAFAVGMVLFAPALLFMMNGDDADELGRLKGEYDAIQSSGTQKSCGLPDPNRPTQTAAAT
jgi:hypothetical protein